MSLFSIFFFKYFFDDFLRPRTKDGICFKKKVISGGKQLKKGKPQKSFFDETPKKLKSFTKETVLTNDPDVFKKIGSSNKQEKPNFSYPSKSGTFADSQRLHDTDNVGIFALSEDEKTPFDLNRNLKVKKNI